MPVTMRWSPVNAPRVLNRNLRSAASWMPKTITRTSRIIGLTGVRDMQHAVAPNRYTGALSDSISAEYSDGDTVITISPKALRGGRWDAGSILEFGTRPIARCPYVPIKTWASVKGAPMPGAWLKIRLRGVSPHPFLDRTMDALGPHLDPIMSEMLDYIINHYIFAGMSG